MQFPELACSSLNFNEVQWAYMKFHELACSFMRLHAVPFFVWAAHKNFAVLVYIFTSKKNAKLFYLHFNVLLTSFSHDNLWTKTKNRSVFYGETLIKFKFSRMRFFRTRRTKQLFRQLIVLINSNQFISVNEVPRKKFTPKHSWLLFSQYPNSQKAKLGQKQRIC